MAGASPALTGVSSAPSDSGALRRTRASQDPAIFYYELGTPAGRQDHALVNVGPVIARLTLRSPANLPILAPRLRNNLRALYP